MSERPLRIAIIGSGLMGTAISKLAPERGLEVAGMLTREDMADPSDDTRALLGHVDIALEFTAPAAAVANVLICLDASCPVIVGTTGWYDALPEVTAAVSAEGGSLLWAPNFSLGVAILSQLVRRAGQLAAGLDQFEVRLQETHHTAKRDSPSGTALALEATLASGLGRSVPISSVRTGTVPGTHEVTFDGPFEQITLTHEALDRRVFADGALTAARWLMGRTGVFTMDDVFGVEPT
jgi:4-hydroxy-tetrahydrodipicolinate reductase